MISLEYGDIWGMSAQAVIKVGDKVHIISRRAFKEDIRRHFAGMVVATAEPLARIEGFVFVYNSMRMEYRKRPEIRTRVFNLGESNHIVNVLPEDVGITKLRYGIVEDRLMLMDGHGFAMDINEFNDES